jgi:hypothetical protein
MPAFMSTRPDSNQDRPSKNGSRNRHLTGGARTLLFSAVKAIP